MSRVPLIDIDQELSGALARLKFQAPVHTVYNPMVYAAEPRQRFLQRFGSGRKPYVLVGMNPGPFGMVQTGVPFGTCVWSATGWP